MSYDLNIFRVNSLTKRFTLSELEEKLHPIFDLFEHDYAHEDGVQWFVVHYSDQSPSNNWEFCYQEDRGCYSTSCSYGSDEETFTELRKVAKDVAVLLNAQIQDPQISEKIVDPKDFDVNDSRMSKIRILQKQVSCEVAMKNGLSNTNPSIESYCSRVNEDKYFILYFMISRTPAPGNLNFQYLALDDGRFFASKVNVGETLTEVLTREIPELTGSSTYYVDNIIDKYDSALDKYGKNLPRTAVFLRIPYFNPNEMKTKYKMKWVDVPST